MSITEAFEQFMTTPAFSEIAKQKDKRGGKYRVYRGRFKKGLLKIGAMVEILLEHGYDIMVRKM